MKKSSVKISKIFSIYYVIISLIGLCMITFLTFNSSIATITLHFQKQIIGIIFCSICLMGIIAGISPKKCSRKIHLRIPKREKMALLDEKIKGHHPICKNFSTHVLKLGKSYHCIGCIGMVIGAIISMIGSIFFFFLDYNLRNFDIIIFFAGFLGILYGLIIFNLNNVGKIARFFSNTMYVVGAFLLLIGIYGMTSNFLLEIYLIIIIIFWIMTRIALSQYKHKKICVACQLGSCIFNEKES